MPEAFFFASDTHKGNVDVANPKIIRQVSPGESNAVG
jgi:hypothetical protein